MSDLVAENTKIILFSFL